MANRIKESNITPGAVTSDKIAPGTVSASNISPGSITTTQIATDTIASSNIAPGTIANDRLANNSVTINGTSIALGASGTIVAGTDWQSVVTADGSTATTASAGEGYFIDTTSAAHTINLPSSPTQGDEVTIVDYAGTFGSNAVTVGRNGSNIDGVANDGTLATNRLNVRFVYIDATQGWRAIFDDASENYGATYVTATGGTITTSGDYKIHTFTGDGCFVVSSVGNPAGSTSVDYLVVAGGGGGGGDDICTSGGGGGGGGFRYSASTFCAGGPAAPLANPTAIPVSATTYPITVGGGGTPGPGSSPQDGGEGSNSVFSTITSTGGGGGGHNTVGTSGGSGGGAGRGGYSGGSGNTPPVSPPQGNNGGDGAPTPTQTPNYGSAGGGGATAVGSNGLGADPGGGPGGAGAGLPNAFGTSGENCGSNYYFSGGGGGGIWSNQPNPGVPIGIGGIGGGGDAGAYLGPQVSSPGSAGTGNTGGGGGGATGGNPTSTTGGAGGKGIVIIRYKYQ